MPASMPPPAPAPPADAEEVVVEDASDDEQEVGGGVDGVLHANAIDMFGGGNGNGFHGNSNAAALMQAEMAETTAPREMDVTEDTEEAKEDEEELQCYICWEAGTAAHPILRECGCSGSAGRAHVQCLIEAARTRSGDSLLDPLLRPWARCNQCRRPYTGQTREALLRAMAEDRAKTWRKRLLSFLGTGAVTVAFSALYFAFVCSMDKIVVHLAEKLELWWATAGPAWQLSWEESREEIQTVVIAVTIGAVVAAAAWIWNDIRDVVLRHMGRLAMLAVLFDVALIKEQPENYGTSSLLGHFMACTALLGAVAYRNRFALRDEIVQVRREGIMSAMLGLAFGLFLLAIHVYIDQFIGEVLPGKIKTFDRAASNFFDRLLAFVGWGGKPDLSVDAFLERTRQQFWYCCA